MQLFSFTYPLRVSRHLSAILAVAGLLLFSFSPLSAQINYGCTWMNATFSNQNGALTESGIPGVFGLNRDGSTQGLGTGGRTTMQNGYLRTKMPRGKVLGQDTGFRFDLSFPGTSEAELRYKVYFEGSYHWTMGGKLPGLGGGGGGSDGSGRPPRGCTQFNDDGFSARLMFRNNMMNSGTTRTTAYMITYVYNHSMNAGDCGINYQWDDNTSQSGTQRVEIQRGTWYEFRQYIKNSSAGSSNGQLKTWYRRCNNNNSCSGTWKRVENYNNIPWKKSGKTFNIDQILMETYHGGSGDGWTPSRDNYVRFDDFKLYRKGTCSSSRLANTTIGDGMVNVITVDDFGYDDKELTISVFPNPATDRISVVKQTMTNGAMSIINLRGQVVSTWNVVEGQTNSEIDIVDLPQGMYLVQFISEGQSVTQKFIKR